MRWLFLFLAVTASAQLQSSVQWEVSFEYSESADFTNATRYPVTLTVPFEHDSGFVRVVAEKVEVEDMKKTLLALMSLVVTNASGDLLIMPAAIKNHTPTALPAPGTLYPGLSIAEPAGITWDGFSTFDPPVVEMASTPVIAEWTRTAGENETIIYASEEAITNFVVYGAGANSEVSPGAYTGYGSATMPAAGMLLLWPEYGGVTGTPVRVNNTEAWWVNPKIANAGEAIRIFGRNLGAVCKAWCVEEAEWITSTSCNGYMATFTVPGGWTSGTKTLYAHNGYGRNYGRAEAVEITVAAPTDWGAGTIRYITATYSAEADGVDDDSVEINQAISDAANGDTLYFEAGSYGISGTVDFLDKKLRIIGEGMDTTEVFTLAGFTPLTAFDNVGDGSHFVNITLGAGDHIDTNNDTMIHAQDADDLVFSGVRFSELRRTVKEDLSFNVAHHFYNGRRLLFTNCVFNIAGRLNLSETKDVLVIDCDFAGLWDNNALVRITGGSQLAFVGNVVSNYNNSDYTSGYGWIKGRFINSTTHGANNVYVGGNTGVDLGPRYDYSLDTPDGWYDADQVDQNSGEFAMTEGAMVAHTGTPTSFTSNTVTFAALDSDVRADHTLTIVSGTGFGQSRTVTNVSGNRVDLDLPFEVLPDTSSEITIGGYCRRFLCINNNIDGRPRNIIDLISNRNIASAGFEPYDGASEWIIDGNTFHEVRTPVAMFSRWQDSYVGAGATDFYGMPMYFNVVRNNVMDTCRVGVSLVADTNEGAGTYHPMINYLGNVVSSNSLVAPFTAFNVSEDGSLNGTMYKTLLENNNITGGATNTAGFSASYWITSGNTTNGIAWP